MHVFLCLTGVSYITGIVLENIFEATSAACVVSWLAMAAITLITACSMWSALDLRVFRLLLLRARLLRFIASVALAEVLCPRRPPPCRMHMHGRQKASR